ncbi:MAG TPA: cysteine synthase A [Nitrospira sp.]|uniref:cysteine synthase A n=1 Tax=Nitrospira sp. ND1 TaxID=1658518 RepID=UPI0009B9CD69|nr:cysteine synthase A [Nitrospira sp. ND1]MBK7419994.1 cysteine synthase A [Nitrospira sp.]MBK7486784.1 cysteine synthase A [Nitrospira sp.]MBK8378236.1 cysteine synthase A [Nitrospira sp.]MBK9999017.1 cysteine synthase A [Nitrospira sp.]MBP6199030.1 cysteine synthase A [Nitrospira sp.]
MTVKAHADITELIGGTPLVRLNRLSKPGGATIYAKVESFNPGGSIKDRICLNMINEAERLGKLKPGGTIVEPTSGNTGIGLALVAAVRGYKLILVMPESMSMERASLLSSYGAQLVLTAAWEGMKGSIKEAESIVAQNPSYYMPDQFSNPANPDMHRKTTGPEIVNALDGRVDAFVAAVGTGGTITGCGEVIRERNPAAKIVAVEPAGSPVLSGGDPGPHKIQGIGAGFVPKVLNRTLLDRVVTVTDDEAYQTAKLLAKKEGLLVGISAGANVFAAQKIAEELGPGKNVVTILCDTGERYISIEKYFNI